MVCIIHYPQLVRIRSKKFVDVDQFRHATLVKALDARRTLGRNYIHSPQCDAVPDQFTEGLQYHTECYKNFTRVISDLKKKDEASKSAASAEKTDYAEGRPNRTKETDSAGRFPLHCMFWERDL